MEKETQKERILLNIRKSRKAFFIEYFCGLVLLVGLSILIVKGINFNPIINYFVGGLAFISIGSAEFLRLFSRYIVTNEKIVVTHGLFKQARKSMYFKHLVLAPEFNTSQSRLERLLDYGSINIKVGGTTSLEIKDVDSPNKVMDVIEKLIEKAKNET